jgi:hypothetical protein
MLEKRVVFSQVECTASGFTQIRFEKQIVENTEIVAREYHRTALEPGMVLERQMELVNQHLGQMGYPPVGAADIERIRRIVEVEHTPARIAAFAAMRAAAAEAAQLKG